MRPIAVIALATVLGGLVATEVAQAADADGDGVPDVLDPCISFPLSNPLDSNGDGIPDKCQCGDVSPVGGDGLLGFDDATGFAPCFITGGTTAAFTCTQLPLGKGDTQRDGLWGFDDATNVAQAFIGALPSFSLTCEARPEGTPTPTPIEVYGAWHCGDDFCTWASVRDTSPGGEFDIQNHWLIDRGDGVPSVNLAVLSFVDPLKLLNLTTDAVTLNGVQRGMR